MLNRRISVTSTKKNEEKSNQNTKENKHLNALRKEAPIVEEVIAGDEENCKESHGGR